MDDSIWVNLSADELDQIMSLIRTSPYPLKALLPFLGKIAEASEVLLCGECKAFRAAAYQQGFDVDDNALVRFTDEGALVHVWVNVYNSEAVEAGEDLETCPFPELR